MHKVLLTVAVALLLPVAAAAQDSAALPLKPAGETMALRAAVDTTPADADAVRGLLSGHLAKSGYTLSPDDGTARYIAVFQVGFDKGTVMTREVIAPAEPEVRQPPPSMGMGMDSMNGNMSMMPEPPAPRFSTSTAIERVYRGAFVLDIFDRAKTASGKPGLPVYHAQFVASGPCASVPALIAPILTALFRNFPDSSGKPLTVSMPANKSC